MFTTLFKTKIFDFETIVLKSFFDLSSGNWRKQENVRLLNLSVIGIRNCAYSSIFAVT